MIAALLYRPKEQWRICAACFATVLLHVAAVAVANREPQPSTDVGFRERDVIDLEFRDDQPSSDQREELPPPDFPPPIDEITFPEEHSTPPRVVRSIQREVKPLVSQIVAPSRIQNGPPGRALAVTAPRPEYPYEARRQHLTGSGIAAFSIDSATGAVLDVSMLRSTGSAVLDNAAISGFRRWRFKPGAPSHVQTPITFTLTGAAY